MMGDDLTDQGLWLAADRLWKMVDVQLDEAVMAMTGEGIDWSQWQAEGVGYFELVVQEKSAEMFQEAANHSEVATDLRNRWDQKLNSHKVSKKATTRAIEMLSMLGTIYWIRDSMRADGATEYFDLAANAYRMTGGLREVLFIGQKRTQTGRATGGKGGNANAVNSKSRDLRAWAVQQYESSGKNQPAQTFARKLFAIGIPDDLKLAIVSDHERVMADAIRIHKEEIAKRL